MFKVKNKNTRTTSVTSWRVLIWLMWRVSYCFAFSGYGCQVYPGPPQMSKMESFATTVNDFQLLANVAKRSVLDICEVLATPSSLYLFSPKVLQYFVPWSYLKEITANNTLSRFPNFVFILLFRRLTYSLVTECFFMASFNKRR